MNFFVIALTGTPGTGKTTLARVLKRVFPLYHLDITRYIKKHHLHEGYDHKRKCFVVDEKKIAKALQTEIRAQASKTLPAYLVLDKQRLKKEVHDFLSSLTPEKQRSILLKQRPTRKKHALGIILDSHLAHYLPAKEVDLCIVTKTDLKRLKKRLQRRKYSKAKVFENMQAEIFDTCATEAKEKKHTCIICKT